MPDQIKNALIGLFVISALAILGFALMFLHPRTSDEAQQLHVRFASIDKITLGTRVTFAGKPVGEVVKVTELESPRTEKYFGDHVYTYELTLAIDSHVRVYNSDEISLRTSGLLGERSVVITPRKPKKGIRLRPIGPDDILYATEAGSLEETFAEFNNFAERAEETFDAIMDMLEDIKQHNVWEYIGKTAENLTDITTALDSPDDWSDTLANMRAFSEKANNLLDRFSDTWDSVEETVQNASKVSENFIVVSDDAKAMTHKAASGEGTIGSLFMRDELYLRAQSLMSRGETLLDDMNHYGLLYQNDSGWQRLRARRANIMAKLRCPQEFRNFFDDEVDQINTSLNRVYHVMDQTITNCSPQDLMCNRDFAKLFAELLLRIKGLEDNIKLYNEQLIDIHENECCQ